MATVHLEVAGKVQGVGFRWFVRQAAIQSGVVAGWVRNRSDGRVEIAAAGSDIAIAEFVEATRTGPPGARVEHVADLPIAGLDDLPRPFTVLR